MRLFLNLAWMNPSFCISSSVDVTSVKFSRGLFKLTALSDLDLKFALLINCVTWVVRQSILLFWSLSQSAPLFAGPGFR
ncbi:unnamed protein product [Acanthoscelides obtectus]|uniref:Uncharacterized protein n=1 Tax=Acanthoscelides obtectus TaxID=200917 RepID=A0A9P0K0F4_ACAOB|nr:unnamed protein product [Acanthoscelides obtectus]CAK1658448.1 hypothetical protein AOBTE_LOCUS20900 [Acanthoscelides obtectus]